jgi:hypothetical protein
MCIAAISLHHVGYYRQMLRCSGKHGELRVTQSDAFHVCGGSLPAKPAFEAK